jgi:hypothetical protein
VPVEIALPDDDECFTLDEFIESLEQEGYDLSDQDDLVASAPYLKKLANNKNFLVDRMLSELKDIISFQSRNSYAPEVLLLHATSRYFVRANIWKPISKIEKQVPGFRYDVCHDHNFNILTAGYLGPGYQCRTYTYNYADCAGILGETLPLTPEGVFTLSEGKVALYRAKRDVHIQLPPERLSVSINLIPRGSVQNEMQFQIDESTHKICRYLDFSGADAVVRLAGLLGAEEHIEPLACIAKEHPSAKLRALACVSLLQLAPKHAGAVQQEIDSIPSPLVRHIIATETASYGASLRSVN